VASGPAAAGAADDWRRWDRAGGGSRSLRALELETVNGRYGDG